MFLLRGPRFSFFSPLGSTGKNRMTINDIMKKWKYETDKTKLYDRSLFLCDTMKFSLRTFENNKNIITEIRSIIQQLKSLDSGR